MDIAVQIKTLTKEVIMPRNDKTGPEGRGSMTGRGLGSCTGENQSNFNSSNFGLGRRLGRGMGIGRSFGNRFQSGNRWFNRGFNSSSDSEKSVLENEIKTLKEQLGKYEDRLSQLEKNS
jgi:hypothetical protein